MNPPRKILVVDDERSIARVLRHALESAGYQVRLAYDGGAGIESFHAWLPDLVITDLSMPGLDGLHLCRRVRQLGTTPILVLSVKGDEAAKVDALDAGADDYVAKPFSMAELTARVRALLRRANPEGAQEPFTAGRFQLDPGQRLVTLDGEPLRLTPKEYELLRFFLAHHGKVLTHRAILTAVWGSNSSEQPEYLRVFIGGLRKKLGDDPRSPRHIRTEPWIGYRFDVE